MLETILVVISGLIVLVATSPIWISILIAVGISLLLVFVLFAVLMGKLVWLGWKVLHFICFTILTTLGFLIVAAAVLYLLNYFKLL